MDEVKRYGELDSLRGFAALAVVVYHVALGSFPRVPEAGGFQFASTGLLQLSGLIAQTVFNGQSAVMLFFVLSGFVLGASGSFMDGIGVRKFAGYLVKRFCRLVLPLWFAVAAAVLVQYLSRGVSYPTDQLLAFFLVQDLSINGALWSIPPEIFASVLYPFLFFAVARLSPAIQFVGLLAVISLQVQLPIKFIGFGWDVNSFLQCFYLGIAVPGLGRVIIVRLGRAASWLIPVALFGIGFTYYGNLIWPLATPLYVVSPICCFYLISWVVYGQRNGSMKILQHPLSLALGRWSYSLYLLHIPVISLTFGWAVNAKSVEFR